MIFFRFSSAFLLMLRLFISAMMLLLLMLMLDIAAMFTRCHAATALMSIFHAATLIFAPAAASARYLLP